MSWKGSLIGLLLLGTALAHDTQQAGSVQVTLSTSADDGLATEAPTTLQWTFQQAGQPLAACRCRVLLYAGTPSARVPPVQDLMVPGLSAGVTRVNLAPVKAGRYTVVLDARPQTFGTFNAFRLRYILETP